MNSAILPWQVWALLAAAFAALTAIFGKVGVEAVNSDFATLIRTAVILAITAGIVAATGAWQPLASVSGKSWIFLALSGMATGASWICYYRALKLGPAAQVRQKRRPAQDAPQALGRALHVLQDGLVRSVQLGTGDLVRRLEDHVGLVPQRPFDDALLQAGDEGREEDDHPDAGADSRQDEDRLHAALPKEAQGHLELEAHAGVFRRAR